jgi:hypothetical protein
MTTSVTHVDVVLVADADDQHYLAVEAQLQALQAQTLRLNLSDLPTRSLISQVGALDVAEEAGWARVDHETTVWWYRAGSVQMVGDVAADEAQLIVDEAPAILIGSLRAAGVRWVDDPDAIRKAEWKLGQLGVAASLRTPTPEWRATNNQPALRQFADGQQLIAKPLSSGRGIAPHVAAVPPDDLDDPGELATLFQYRVKAQADVRVVVVDGQSWAWRRLREPETVDWRAVDPIGRGFSRVTAETLGSMPARITSALGLTMSVQDWLETEDGPIFLEANPQGNWLFLDGAEQEIGSALAEHLCLGLKDRAGTWPEPRRRAFYDFLSKERAPDADGVVPPQFAPPVWADEVAGIPGVVEVARSAREAAEDAAKAAEDKASRLVQVTLALLTVGLALGSYQLTFSLERNWPWLFSLLPIAVALGCLAVAAFEGVLIDRVGFYYRPSGRDLSGTHARDPTAALLVQEERGRRLARWSSDHKHTDLMQARAWFTRGLAALLLAGLVAGTCRATASASDHSSSTSSRPASAAIVQGSTTPTEK